MSHIKKSEVENTRDIAQALLYLQDTDIFC